MKPPLQGLVLAGGQSSRMQTDKAALSYGRSPQLARAFELLAPRVRRAYVSVRAEQAGDPLRAGYPQVVDGTAGSGPIAGIIAAQARHPDAAWLVLACDLPLLDGATLDQLIAGRDPGRLATAFRNATNGLPEPLCAIYEPASREPVLGHVAAGRDCPRKFLLTHDVLLLDPARPDALDNANTPQDYESMRASIATKGVAP
jgi:molybdopterin-guanine dinucleotide biosynthesis protein A